MNERIKKLAEQASLQEIIDDAYLDKNDWQPFVKKFAELIVRECIGIVLKEHDEGIDRHGDYQLACYELYREIKQHFGFEE